MHALTFQTCGDTFALGARNSSESGYRTRKSCGFFVPCAKFLRRVWANTTPFGGISPQYSLTVSSTRLPERFGLFLEKTKRSTMSKSKRTSRNSNVIVLKSQKSVGHKLSPTQKADVIPFPASVSAIPPHVELEDDFRASAEAFMLNNPSCASILQEARKRAIARDKAVLANWSPAAAEVLKNLTESFGLTHDDAMFQIAGIMEAGKIINIKD